MVKSNTIIYMIHFLHTMPLPINPFPYTFQMETNWKMRGGKNTLITFTPLHNQIYSKKANWRSMNTDTDNKLYTLRHKNTENFFCLVHDYQKRCWLVGYAEWKRARGTLTTIECARNLVLVSRFRMIVPGMQNERQ